MTPFKGFTWNTVEYRDCLDEERGMQTFDDEFFDLGFADPPFEIEFKGKKKKFRSDKKKYYDDSKGRLKYIQWCIKWSRALMRICKMVIIHVGKPNLEMWYKISSPRDKIELFKKNQSITPSSSAYLCKTDPMLTYGGLKRRLSWDIIECTINMKKEIETIHPCPMPFVPIFKIISELEPRSVIDPFLGSGTTAQACKALGVKWFGYEKDPSYSMDIDKRLQSVVPMKKRNIKQKELELNE